MHTQTQQDMPVKNLKERVLLQIAKDGVVPRSRFVCKCNEWGIWLLWLCTIIVGAIMFSEVMYISMHSGVEFYELTHENLVRFVISSLPIIWIVTLCSMVALTVLHIRLTKCGYRYSLMFVLGTSLVLTVVVGLVFNVFGVGKRIDMLMSHMPMPYQTVEDRQAYLWAHPEDGRITGMMIGTVGTTSDGIFLDVVDREWVLKTDELTESDRSLLISGERVRLIGKAIRMESPRAFVVCSVHPWMHYAELPLGNIVTNWHHVHENMDFHNTQATKRSLYLETTNCMDIMNELMPEK